MNREENMNWFHGKLSRIKCEEILREGNYGNGTFLVRESSTSIGDYVLSVVFNGDIWHYQIRRHGEDAFFSIDQHTPVHGLDSLIEQYQTSTHGLITQLTTFIRKDFPPHDSRSHGRTNLLHRATKEGDFTVVNELLKCGYRNIDAKNQDGQTAVHLACKYPNEKIIRKLIDSGANVNCRDSEGNTPLHYACRNQTGDIIKLLVDAKANIQARNNDTGCVPIHEAAKVGNFSALRKLLEMNAPDMPRSTFGELPIDFAKDNGHKEIVEYLEKYSPMAPSTYKHQWYHGTLEREEASKLLKKHYIDTLAAAEPSVDGADVTADNYQINNVQDSEKFGGIFLVRFSKNSNEHVLSLFYDQMIKHFKIKQYCKYFYIDEGPYLISLEHLIQHYMNFSDGLPCNLKQPVSPVPKPPLPLFSTIPRGGLHKEHSNAKHNLNHKDHPERTEQLHNDSCSEINNSSNPAITTISTLTTSVSDTLPTSTQSTLFRKLQQRKDSMPITESVSPTSEKPIENDSIYNNLGNLDVTNANNVNGSHSMNPTYFTECDTKSYSNDNRAGAAEYFIDNPNLGKISLTSGDTDVNSNFQKNNCMELMRLQATSGSNENYFIPKECLVQNEILGEGEFGSVYRGVYRYLSDSNQIGEILVAIKTLHDEHCQQNRTEFLREASLMLKLKHHCIVHLIGISKGPPLMMVQEMVSLGSMLDYILSNSEKINPNFELKIWASQIACGMSYLESHRFVHRDLAARNILLASIHQVKISDFGLSRALGTDNNYYQATQGGKWPIKWYAPESFNFGTFSHASDVWSFGVTLWEMYSMGAPPYGDMPGVEVIQQIELGQRLAQPEHCPEHVFSIMSNCWNYKPRDRPTFQHLTQFFASDPDYQNLIELIKTETIN